MRRTVCTVGQRTYMDVAPLSCYIPHTAVGINVRNNRSHASSHTHLARGFRPPWITMGFVGHGKTTRHRNSKSRLLSSLLRSNISGSRTALLLVVMWSGRSHALEKSPLYVVPSLGRSLALIAAATKSYFGSGSTNAAPLLSS